MLKIIGLRFEEKYITIDIRRIEENII